MTIEPNPSVATVGRSRRTALSVAIAVIATIPIFAGSSGASDEPTAIANGWIGFAAYDSQLATDLYLVREGSDPRRITGSGTDATDEICPAFSPDGTRLAFGQASGSQYQEGGYSGDAALVITDLSVDGVRTATTTIALEGAPHPPCGIWSADGRWVAFGVETTGTPDEVWVVDTQSDDIHRLGGLSATDLDWAPDAAALAIASDGIVLYSVTTDETRPLGGAGAGSVAWSRDGRTIAFMRAGGLWLMDADGTNERILVPAINAMVVGGPRPVWSPDDERIAYQRRTTFCPMFDGACSEETEVVLVTVNEDDLLEPAGSQVVIPPPQTTGPDGPLWWYPWRVTWSPDGTTLLYYAWAEGSDLATTQAIPDGIVAVPVDGETPPVVLSGDLDAAMLSADPWLPIQSWGRQQGG